jgi:hypothetical protein
LISFDINAPIVAAEHQKKINSIKKTILGKETKGKKNHKPLQKIKFQMKSHFHDHHSEKERKEKAKGHKFLGLGDGVNSFWDAWIGLILMSIWFFGFSTSTRS